LAPDLEKIEAEIESRRIEAQHRIVRTRRIVKYVVGTILVSVGILLVLFLGQYSDRVSMPKALLVASIILGSVAIEAVALRLNAMRDRPWSEFAISLVFVGLLFAVLTAVI